MTNNTKTTIPASLLPIAILGFAIGALIGAFPFMLAVGALVPITGVTLSYFQSLSVIFIARILLPTWTRTL